MKNLILLFFVFTAMSIQAQVPVVLEFDEIREITEINEGTVADAYPWISEDGLRMYFQKEDYSGNLIYQTSRNSSSDHFSEPVMLNCNFTDDDNISPWLTQDELNLFFVRRIPSEVGVTLLRASRNSTDETFNTIDQVQLNGIDDVGDKTYFIARPTFTPDLKQLFVYHSYQTTEILILNEDSENNYSVTDTLELPEGYQPAPGALTSDGLRYYIPLSQDDNDQAIYYFERGSLENEFQDLYYIDNATINEFGEDSSHPYMTANGDFLVYTHATGSWPSNDLFIAQNNPTSVENLSSLSKHYAFPNPVKKQKLTIHIPEKSGELLISVYNMNGKLLQRTEADVQNKNAELLLRHTKPGIYIAKYKINGKTFTHKFTISP